MAFIQIRGLTAAEFAVIKIIKCLISSLALNFLLGIRQTAERFCRFTVFPQLGLVALVAIPSGTALKVSLQAGCNLFFFACWCLSHMMVPCGLAAASAE